MGLRKFYWLQIYKQFYIIQINLNMIFQVFFKGGDNIRVKIKLRIRLVEKKNLP